MENKALVPTGKDLTQLTEAAIQAMVQAEIEADKDSHVFRPPAVTFKAGVFTIENADFVSKELQGVVVLARNIRGYWPDEIDDPRPLCSSVDGHTGITRAGEAVECAKCPMNEWGSDEKGGRGKACGEYRLLLAVPGGMAAPVRLRLPVTSIGNWDAYVSGLRVTGKGQSYFTVETKLTLTKAVREGNQEYYVANFTRVRALDVPELRTVLAARKEFETILARVQTQELVGDKEGKENEEAPF